MAFLSSLGLVILSTVQTVVVSEHNKQRQSRNWRLLFRLKATLERIHRLAQGYTDSLLDILAKRASKLGSALGIPSETRDVGRSSFLSRHCCVSRSETTLGAGI